MQQQSHQHQQQLRTSPTLFLRLIAVGKASLHFSQVFPPSHGSGRRITFGRQMERGVTVHAHLSGDPRQLTGVTSAESIG